MHNDVHPEAPRAGWDPPCRLRALLGYDKQICAEVLAAVIKELDRSLKRRAKKLLGLSTVKEALTGAVAAVQRVDSAIRLNLHFHILGLDGVFVRPYPDHQRSEITFHDLPTPTREETEDIARRIADRVDVILKKHGRSLDPEESDPDPTEVQLEPIQFLPPPRFARRRGPGTGASLLKRGRLLRRRSARSRR